MPRPPAVPPEEKSRLVLAILAGELTVAEAARKAKVSEQSVSNLEALVPRGRPGRCGCRRQGRSLDSGTSAA